MPLNIDVNENTINKDIQLSPRINEIVSFFFANPSMNYTQLSTHFKVSLPRISQIMNHPKVLAAYPVLARRAVKKMVPQAIGRLEHLMNQNENMAVSEKIVSKILDSEKILAPQERKIIHEIQLKSVKELQDIVEGSKAIPKQVIEAEIVGEGPEDAEA